ncbi:RNA-binding domain-containing protein [Verrucomicrobiota bacterium sgz303538]
MISYGQIEQWVKAGESELMEFKRTTGEQRSGVQTLCGMLNHRGGRVLFGVEPDGRISGQMISERTTEDLAQEIQQIEPPVFPAIERVPITENRHVIVVSVSPGAHRPYSHRGQAYRRVGNTTPKLSREEYHRMLLERLHGESRWENEPASDWSIADLDIAEIIRTLDEAIRRGRADDPGVRDPAEILRGMGLMRDSQLLRAAPVLFGRAERLEAYFPQCLLRIARFRGRDKTEFLDNRQLNGNAFDLLLKAERFLRENLPIAGRVRPGMFERIDDPLYPPVALREALANAFCHRDYSIGGGSVGVAIYDDRLEITSSGTLHFGLTPEALFEPHESLPWNPLIARVFYRRGIIETWGRGTIKMGELTTRAGLPRPEIIESGGCVMVRFAPSRYVPPQRVARDVTARQQRVLEALSKEPSGMAVRDIVALLEGAATLRQVRLELSALRVLGLVVSEGHGMGARWRLH